MTSRRARRARQRQAQPAEKPRAATLALPRGGRWLVLALVVAMVLAYVPALAGPFVMDDEDTIGASATWQAPAGAPTAGRPVVLTTLAANFALNEAFGVDQRRDPDGPHKAVGYRLFNLLVHLLTGALLFGEGRQLPARLDGAP